MVAFFLAAFLGVIFAVLSVGFGKLIRSRGRQMPFGPQLAAATFVVMVWREPIAAYFMSLF
jgi:prepilin signal peptidase PulO-like enzyme (type II secretory pathway)